MTEKEVLDCIKAKDKETFAELYYNSNDQVEIAYDQNYGDGNDYIVCLYFRDLDLYVKLEGSYSSWDSAQWHEVSLAEPFEYIETRYKSITIDHYLKNSPNKN